MYEKQQQWKVIPLLLAKCMSLVKEMSLRCSVVVVLHDFSLLRQVHHFSRCMGVFVVRLVKG